MLKSPWIWFSYYVSGGEGREAAQQSVVTAHAKLDPCCCCGADAGWHEQHLKWLNIWLPFFSDVSWHQEGCSCPHWGRGNYLCLQLYLRVVVYVCSDKIGDCGGFLYHVLAQGLRKVRSVGRVSVILTTGGELGPNLLSRWPNASWWQRRAPGCLPMESL